MKAARERYPHVLPLFALWEYISEEWVLDSWTKQNGGQQTVADGKFLLPVPLQKKQTDWKLLS